MFESDELIIEGLALDHGNVFAHCAYRIREKERPGRINPQLAESHGITGHEFAKLLQGLSVRGIERKHIASDPRPGRSIAVLGDCRPSNLLLNFVADSDVIVARTPYLDERWERAVATQSLTGWEAARIARDANAKLLALVHLDVSSNPEVMVKESMQFFSSTVVPNDRSVLNVPDRDPAALPFLVSGSKPLGVEKASGESSVKAKGVELPSGTKEISQ